MDYELTILWSGVVVFRVAAAEAWMILNVISEAMILAPEGVNFLREIRAHGRLITKKQLISIADECAGKKKKLRTADYQELERLRGREYWQKKLDATRGGFSEEYVRERAAADGVTDLS